MIMHNQATLNNFPRFFFVAINTTQYIIIFMKWFSECINAAVAFVN